MQKRRAATLFIAILISIPMSVLFFPYPAFSEYPEKPVTLLVGFEAGGAADLLTRGIAAEAAKRLGQPVVVENRGGGGGAVALGVLSAAKPDGYTLCETVGAAIINGPLVMSVPFKPLRSIAPIVGFATAAHVGLLVRNDAPWKTFKELVEYAKKNPGKIKYGSAGVGTGMHIGMEAVGKEAGVKWVHVPYKGSPSARAAAMGGHIEAFSSAVDWPPLVKSGDFRILATYGEKRSPDCPEVPTLKELGYSFVHDVPHMVAGPAGMPKELLKRLETIFTKATQADDFKKLLARLYYTPFHRTGEECSRFLEAEWVATEKIFKDIGVIKEPATSPK